MNGVSSVSRILTFWVLQNIMGVCIKFGLPLLYLIVGSGDALNSKGLGRPDVLLGDVTCKQRPRGAHLLLQLLFTDAVLTLLLFSRCAECNRPTDDYGTPRTM